MRISGFTLPALLASALLAPILTGCATTTMSSPIASAGLAIQGNVHGGEQPVVGAHVYLMAANTTAYGAASTSLLTAATLHSDSVGNYVPTLANGSFSITGDYTCTPNSQVYIYALGGNPGAGTNSAAGFLSVLGNCPSAGTFLAATPYVFVNEISTIAGAYAMAGFAVDATHVSSSGTALALTGIANAFANSAQMVPIATGATLTKTPAGNGNVPFANINTLANIIASCTNSTGPSSTSCTTLFADATSGGSNPVTPTDTATAAINIAHNPGANVAALYALVTSNSPYPYSLAQQPQDFTLGLDFTGGGINEPYSIAMDAGGNAWITNLGTSSVTKLSNLGVAISPTLGYTSALSSPVGIGVDLNGNVWVADAGTSKLYEFSTTGTVIQAGLTGGGLAAPQGIAIDGSNNIWLPNGSGTGSLSEFSNAGAAISPSAGYTGGGINGPFSIAIDTAGAVWTTSTKNNPANITKTSNAGVAISPSTGYFGGGINRPYGVAIDGSGNAWVSNNGNNTISKLSSAGAAISSSSGYTGGGLNQPYGLAIDGGGNVWVADYGQSAISEFSNAGAAISPAFGFTGGTQSNPTSVSIDGSGNLWIANQGGSNVTELIGAAVPRVTPLAAGVKNGALGTRP